MRIASSILALLLALGPAAEAAEALDERARAAIERAEALGRTLHGKTRAAEIANDVLIREGILQPGMRGPEKPFQARISMEVPGGWLVRFLSDDDGRVVANYDVQLQRLAPKGATMVVHPTPVEVEKNARRMFRARALAPAIVAEPCASTYVVAVVPHVDLGGSGWTVFALAGEKGDEIAVGGHYRAEVSLEGTELQGSKKLSRGCLTLNKKELGPPGAKVAGVYVVEQIADYPTEIHVYLSLRHELDAYVQTRNGQWLVSDGRIEKVEARR
jgi:hypothetical protein